MKNKKAQIWIETVIYTLIAIVLLGLVIAFAKPYIEKQKDKAIIDSAIGMMNEIDNQITDVKRKGVSNQREVSFFIKKGQVIVDAPNNEIKFELESTKYEASALGQTIQIPGTALKIKTEKAGSNFKVAIWIKYSDANILYENQDTLKEFETSPSPYRIMVEKLSDAINLYEV